MANENLDDIVADLDMDLEIVNYASTQLSNEHVPHDRVKLSESMDSTKGQFYKLMQAAEQG